MEKEKLRLLVLSNPIGYTKEKTFKSRLPEVYMDLISYNYPIEFKFSQKLYHYINDDMSFKIGICKNCKKRCRYVNITYGYKEYCSNNCASIIYWNNMTIDKKEDIFNKVKECWKNKCKDELSKFSETMRNIRLNEDITKKEIRQDNILKSKKKNKSFNSSKSEDLFEKWLIENNFNYIRQYKEKRYPFACDFYFPDYDLFLEIQGFKSHMNHPFDKNNEDDMIKLELMKNKNTNFYNNVIKVWTESDTLKRTTAKENNLNWVETFSYKTKDIIEFFINTISNI